MNFNELKVSLSEPKVLFNKYLIKIVIEYISYNLIYENELLNRTKELLRDYNLGCWFYYDKYTICNEDIDNHYYRKNNVIKNQYIIYRAGNYWLIKSKY